MSWTEDAACKGSPVNFFPTRQPGSPVGRQRYERDAAPAKAVCVGCPVKDECLTEALTTYEGSDDGIWGGTSPMDRQALRRAARVTATAGYNAAVRRLG